MATVVDIGALEVTLSTAKLFNWNSHLLEVVSRSRDPQLQVGDNYSDLTKWESTIFKMLLIDVIF